MKKSLLLLAFVAGLGNTIFAQDELFNTKKEPARDGFVFAVSGDFDVPGGDFAKRFGLSYRIGGAVFYKTKTNWMFGPKVDFILGNKIKEDSLLFNMIDENGRVLNQDGQRTGIRIYEQGYMIGLQAGKIFNISKGNADNGILALTSVGFMQHKINIFDRDKTIPQLRGDYRKGYDRLSNGIFVEEYIAYNHFAKNGLVNFNIGFDITAGFTKGRRDYLYDVMRADNSSRVDILFGVRGGWYIPIFKRKSEDYFFE